MADQKPPKFHYPAGKGWNQGPTIYVDNVPSAGTK